MWRKETIERLSRHLPVGVSCEGEMALLSAQSAEKQEVVERRLLVLDRYLSSDSQSAAEADAAAAELGVTRRQLYRLIIKLRELGPVRALSPGFRNVERSAPTRTGLASPVEAAIRKWLASIPDGKIARIQRFVRAECDRLDIEYPGDSAIKRRVHMLRRMAEVPASSSRVGDHILVDQVALDLSVSVASNSKDRLSVVTLVWDRGTQIILGVGLTVGDGIGLGLESALGDFTRRLPALKDVVPAAPRITELTWVVPAGIEYAAEDFNASVLEEGRRPKLNVVLSGPRRHGDAILRSLGDRIEPYAFRKLADLGQDPPASDSPGDSIEFAYKLVSHAVDARNRRTISKLSDSIATAPILGGRLKSIAGDLDKLFAPVFASISAKQNYAHLLEHGWSL